MAITAVMLKIDGEQVVQGLQLAREKLDTGGGELVLDFSAVRRIYPSALQELEQLAAAADRRAVKVVLRGVTVEIYKVLKLVKLAPRFAFLT